MKKFLLCAGLVMAAACMSSCGAKNGGKAGGDDESSCTKTVSINGVEYKIDCYSADNYSTMQQIHGALLREAYLGDVQRPVDASSFGKKTAELEWRAFKNPTKDESNPGSLKLTPIPAGTVTVIHYERGLEVKKDGKSWFYSADWLYEGNKFGDTPQDVFNFWEKEERTEPQISAVESILHPGVWEPATVFISDIVEEITFVLRYGSGYPEKGAAECHSVRNEMKISSPKELVISQKFY